MNTFKMPTHIMENMTQIFQIERDKDIIGSAHGFFCGKDYPHTIQLVENADIKNEDWLIDTTTGQRYYAEDVHPILINRKPVDWMVKYKTEAQHRSSTHSHSDTVFNIHSVSGNSVIGNQESVTLNIGASLSDIERLINNFPDSEKAKADELLDEMLKIESSAHPILIEGSFSKFSDLIKKHTDLLTAVGGWAVKLLIGQ